jgi:hypothetical protein
MLCRTCERDVRAACGALQLLAYITHYARSTSTRNIIRKATAVCRTCERDVGAARGALQLLEPVQLSAGVLAGGGLGDGHLLKVLALPLLLLVLAGRLAVEPAALKVVGEVVMIRQEQY